MKAGPRQSQFEPSEGKAVKFTEVHGVDEAKEVMPDPMASDLLNNLVCLGA
jgi:ATP-dependent metalloprotease